MEIDCSRSISVDLGGHRRRLGNIGGNRWKSGATAIDGSLVDFEESRWELREIDGTR